MTSADNVDDVDSGDELSAEALVREVARLRRKLKAIQQRDGERNLRRSFHDDGGVAGGAGVRHAEEHPQHLPSRPGAYRAGHESRGAAVTDDDDDDDDDDDRANDMPPRAPPLSLLLWPPPLVDGLPPSDVCRTRPDGGDFFFLEAELVEDPVVVVATRVRRGRQALVVAGLVLLALGIVALAVGLPMRRLRTSRSSTAKPDYDLIPVAALQDAFNSSLPHSTMNAILRGDTPQADAYRWLFEIGFDNDDDDDIDGRHPPLPAPDADSRLLTRFTFAVLYYSMKGERDRVSVENFDVGWLDRAQHECLWDGIECGFGGGAETLTDSLAYCEARLGVFDTVSCRLGNGSSSIVSMDLANFGLSGTIPDEIRLLKSAGMTSLRLEGNGLAGAIPPGVGELTTLRHLILSRNKLHGSIPHVLGNLSSLQTLRLSQNELSGTIPAAFANLTGLKHLDISYNRLVGSLPTEVGRLLALEKLDASENWLVGPIPTEISQLTHLVRLELSGNSIAENVLPLVLPMRSLRVLDIGYEMLSGSIPTSLGFMLNLTSLTLSSSSWLSASIPRELNKLDDLVFAKALSMRHKIVWNGRDDDNSNNKNDGDDEVTKD